MAGSQSVTTDMGIGLSVVFIFLAVASAALSFLTPGTVTAAWGFGAAVTAGVLSIAAIHLY
ncbi:MULTISPECIES: hypothetical protein [unclassified Haladaptatus]|uniref:DUF7525 family protein n=1 Tax=unclassified Haladaptatus TaxID=2622732 RepID=UPI00209BD344|nr:MULTISPECIES: hypothetical protein [unclassified Haladaptatus]MCO8245107.1 hypothetical protein [Haladaptatus sp. AB643]MCO8253250.1 hypothetical protein [Haladaptatus sp. AB618]